jgi:hypothetical protein
MGVRGSIKGFGRNQILALGKVSAWLRLSEGTVTGEGYSSVPDLLGGSPAEQTTDARRPVNGASANGLPIATYTADFLSWPLGAGNNGAVKWGMAGWFKLANTTGNKQLMTITSTAGGASANKINPFITGSAMRVDDQVTDRHAQSGTLDTAWHFLTFEVDCSQATEALQVLQSIDTVLQTVSFSSDTAWGAALAVPTGNALIGAGTTGALTPFVGSMGPNLYFLNAQLTPAERAILMNFEAPT